MKLFVSSVLLAAAFALDSTNGQGLQAKSVVFTAWKAKHNKQYSSVSEENYRAAIVHHNKKLIDQHNSKFPNKTFSVSLNKFADLTRTEFAKIYLGGRRNPLFKRESRFHSEKTQKAIPSSVDWRTAGYVTPIKDQGQCGSCWSFSTTGAVEGAYFNKTKKLVSLSEQQLVDCSSAFGNMGCDGGLPDQAFEYLMKNGITTEANYPYQAVQGNCKKPKSTVTTVNGYVDIQKGSEPALKQAVAGVGPISIAIDASQMSFQFYSGGVYNEPACSSTSLDHAVLVVGYGSMNGNAYWIVKNSWGTSWGDQGYILMSRNKNNQCGIASQASYPVLSA